MYSLMRLTADLIDLFNIMQWIVVTFDFFVISCVIFVELDFKDSD